MLNYVKSEFYRISHSKELYCLTAILSIVVFAFNAILAFFGRTGNFRYNTTSYSYSNLVAYPMIFCLMGSVIGVLLYEGNDKNGNLKNAVAFGIPRIRIFAGQCITAAAAAILSMLILLTVFIASAAALLNPTGPVSLSDLLTEIPAVLLPAIAALISAIVFIEIFEKTTAGILLWAVVWFVIPRIFFYLGLRIDALYSVAMWMPGNFFSPNGMIVNMSQCITAWGTPEGMAKCLIAGAVGILAFSILGVILLKKKDL